MGLSVRNDASLQFEINEQSISTSMLLCSVGYTEKESESDRKREKEKEFVSHLSLRICFQDTRISAVG